MFGLTSQVATVFVAVLVLFVAYTESLWCRNGIENRYSSQEWSKKCDYGETACFESVKCVTIDGTLYKDYEWRCIDGSKCSNATGTPTAHYLDVKGSSSFLWKFLLCGWLHIEAMANCKYIFHDTNWPTV